MSEANASEFGMGLKQCPPLPSTEPFGAAIDRGPSTIGVGRVLVRLGHSDGCSTRLEEGSTCVP